VHARERVDDAILEGDLLAPRDEVNEHLRVRGGGEDRALRLEVGPDVVGVGEVAVVTDRERALCVVDRERLSVSEVRAASGRVPHVSDRASAGELLELLGAERILDEAHRAVRVELLAVARHDAGRLLTAVLQSMQPEVRDVGSFAVAVDREHSALVVEVVVFELDASRPPGSCEDCRIENREAPMRHEGRNVVNPMARRQSLHARSRSRMPSHERDETTAGRRERRRSKCPCLPAFFLPLELYAPRRTSSRKQSSSVERPHAALASPGAPPRSNDERAKRARPVVATSALRARVRRRDRDAVAHVLVLDRLER